MYYASLIKICEFVYFCTDINIVIEEHVWVVKNSKFNIKLEKHNLLMLF